VRTVAQPQRIVLLDMPRLLRDIIKDALAGEPRVKLVGEFPTGVTPLAAATEGDADIVIAGASADTGADADALLTVRPHARLLVVSAVGRMAALWELRPHRIELGELSPTGLLSVVIEAISEV